jgi:hypothetical protein
MDEKYHDVSEPYADGERLSELGFPQNMLPALLPLVCFKKDVLS